MVAVSAFAEPDGDTANPVMDRRVARRRPAFFRRHPGGTRAAAGVIAALAQAQDVGDQRVALLGAEQEVGHERVLYGEVAVERGRRSARPGGDCPEARRVVGGRALVRFDDVACHAPADGEPASDRGILRGHRKRRQRQGQYHRHCSSHLFHPPHAIALYRIGLGPRPAIAGIVRFVTTIFQPGW